MKKSTLCVIVFFASLFFSIQAFAASQQPARITDFQLFPQSVIINSDPSKISKADFNVTVKNNTSEEIKVHIFVNVYALSGGPGKKAFNGTDASWYVGGPQQPDVAISANSSKTFFTTLNEIPESDNDPNHTWLTSLPAGNYNLKATLRVKKPDDTTYTEVDYFERNITILRGENSTVNVSELPLPLVALIVSSIILVLYFKRTNH